MASALSASPLAGLTSAAALLQVQLGIGFVLGALGIVVTSSQAVKKQLAGSPWEATLRAAAKAVSPVPLLVSSALLQAQAAPDALASVGFMVSSTAVALGAFLAVVDPIMGAQEEEATPRFLKANRVLNGCRAFGQVLLVFAALPEGTQLLCASCLVRAALAVQAVGAAAGVLCLASGGAVAEVLVELEPVAALAPVLAALALLDSSAWGPGGLTVLLSQPALFGVAHMALVVGVHFLGGSVEDSDRPELDLRFSAQEAGKQAEPVRIANAALLHLTIVLGLARVLVGTYGMEVTLGGIILQWGDPLAATAAALSALILGVYIVEYVLAAYNAEDPPVAKSNGLHQEGSEAAEEPTQPERSRAAIDYLKAIVTPAHALLLAILAARMMNSTSDADLDIMDRVSLVAVAPFRYGFVLAAVAVWLQVASFLVFAICHSDAEHMVEPPFHVTGTLQWQAKGALTNKLAEAVQWVTHALLEGGLLLGCVGLGPTTWFLGAISSMGFLYLAAPPEARLAADTTAKAMGSAALACGGSWFSGLEALLEQRRQTQLAAAALRAAAVAAALEQESAPKGKAAAAAKGQGKGGASKQPVVEKKEAQPAQQAAPQQKGGGFEKKKNAKGNKKK